jgi:hypothetical protein
MILKVMKIFNIVFVLLFATFSACNFIGQGTLGGFEEIECNFVKPIGLKSILILLPNSDQLVKSNVQSETEEE